MKARCKPNPLTMKSPTQSDASLPVVADIPAAPVVLDDAPPKRKLPVKLMILVLWIVVAAGGGFFAWEKLHKTGPGPGFASGNGRIEATEIDIATKLAGRVDKVLVDEGDFVEAGQLVATMQVPVLVAQRDEARAQHAQTISAVAAAVAQVAGRASDKAATLALVTQRESELDAARRRRERTEPLTAKGAISAQVLDDDRASERSAQAAVNAAKAQTAAAQAAINAAEAEVTRAHSGVTAALATIARIEADIADSQLKSPRGGRVQYRVAQPGEMLAGGGTVLNVIDLSDVYMTFFLPEQAAGKVVLGSEVRLVLDAALDYVIPAQVSFVASTAQFTPKTVETKSERQKLMFRVRARIDAEVLQKNIKRVKTGLPGVAWLKLDAKSEWPKELALKVPP
jgi:HlyD family secretion protein